MLFIPGTVAGETGMTLFFKDLNLFVRLFEMESLVSVKTTESKFYGRIPAVDVDTVVAISDKKTDFFCVLRKKCF